ncbi:MAG TPA: GNAT family N-acetyltransferase [candidate division Zixibacteria bacterium]|nr:GNAT family N-acetyltransferase [candidate division Zixibacteria bacterium]
MVSEFPLEKRLDLLPLFKPHKYLFALIEGLVKERMGLAYVNNLENPTVGLIGQKIIFYLSGDSEDLSTPELLEKIPPNKLIFIPDENWLQKISDFWGDKLQTYPRTKFSSEKLDINYLKELQLRLPKGFVIEKLTKENIKNISDQAKNIIHLLFPSIDNFIERNFGFCILDGKKIASLALAASPIYDNTFEIHIETNPKYQRKGLALITCAKLIEYSLNKGLIPHWDADNEPSAQLALKLGFTKSEKYFSYFWNNK